MTKKTRFNFNQIIWIGLALAITVSYNACGRYQTTEELKPLSSIQCADELTKVFNQSYFPIFQNNCAACHSKASAVGPGDFADPDPLEALKSMYEEEYGYPDKLALIDKNAVDPGHPAPTSGPDLKIAIENASEDWAKALVEHDICIGTPPIIKPRTKELTLALPLEETNSTNYVRYELDLQTTADLERGSDLAGAKLIFDMLWEGEEVTGPACTDEVRSPDGKCYNEFTAYKIRNPRITSGDKAILVEKIDLFFNNEFSGTQTTFRNVKVEVPPNSTEFSLLPPGAAPLLLQPDIGFNVGTDTISFEFTDLSEKPDEPEPTPTPAQ